MKFCVPVYNLQVLKFNLILTSMDGWMDGLQYQYRFKEGFLHHGKTHAHL